MRACMGGDKVGGQLRERAGRRRGRRTYSSGSGLDLRFLETFIVVLSTLVRRNERLEDGEELVGTRDALLILAVKRQGLVVRRTSERDEVRQGEDAVSSVLGEAEHLLGEAVVRVEVRHRFEVLLEERFERCLVRAELGEGGTDVGDVGCGKRTVNTRS